MPYITPITVEQQPAAETQTNGLITSFCKIVAAFNGKVKFKLSLQHTVLLRIYASKYIIIMLIMRVSIVHILTGFSPAQHSFLLLIVVGAVSRYQPLIVILTYLLSRAGGRPSGSGLMKWQIVTAQQHRQEETRKHFCRTMSKTMKKKFQ